MSASALVATREPRQPGALWRLAGAGCSTARGEAIVIARAVVAAFVPAFIAYLVAKALGVDLSYGRKIAHVATPDAVASLLLLMVAVSPVVETLLMAAILEPLRRASANGALAVASSTAALAALHALRAPAWAAFVAWPFVVFSMVYVAGRGTGFGTALRRTIIVHAAYNAVVIAILLAAIG